MSKSKTTESQRSVLVEVTTENVKVAYDRFLNNPESPARKESMFFFLLHLGCLIDLVDKVPATKNEVIDVLEDIFLRLIQQLDHEQSFARALERALSNFDIDAECLEKDVVDPVERLDTDSVIHLLTQLRSLAQRAGRYGVEVQIYDTDVIDVLKSMISTHRRRQCVHESEDIAGKMLVKQLFEYQ